MAAVEPALTLRGDGHARRRRIANRVAESVATVAALAAVGVLGVVLWSVAKRGGSELSWGFLTKDLPIPFSPDKGGIAPLLVGSGVLVGLAGAMALPVGVAIAIFLEEFATPRQRMPVQLAVDLLNGLPSIIIGLFIFGLLIKPLEKQMALAASVALAVIQLPLIARGSLEVLLLVPGNLREASDALGVSRWRGVLGVILPSALGGIVTATVLAVARAAGETAPLIFASSVFDASKVSVNPFEALPNIPVTIFFLSEEGNPTGFTRAWGASLVLIAIILFASLGARALLARNRERMTR